jgi:hypothetical protein
MKRFNTLNGMQNWMRKNGCPDYLKFRGMIFTMDEYDQSGQNIHYGNLKNRKTINVQTSDRYSNTKFTDAVVQFEDFLFARIDYPYYE